MFNTMTNLANLTSRNSLLPKVLQKMKLIMAWAREEGVVVLVVIVILFFHLWKLDQVPSTYYVDEAAMGYNAWLIATTAHDEHGVSLPLFFTSFNDYKRPLVIYTAALLLQFFNPSEYLFRFNSVLWFIGFLLGIYVLARHLFPHAKVPLIYSLLAAGFLPWFFTYSRLMFDVVTQLTVIIWALFFIYRAYHVDDHRSVRYAALAGIATGLSIYAYATSQLLAFLLIGGCLMIYARRATLKQSLMLLGSFVLTCLPFVVYRLTHSGAVQARFRSLTYIYSPTFSTAEKLEKFIHGYLSYFDLDFLLWNGDRIVQHATGFGGQVFIIVLALGLLGIIVGLKHRNRFFLLLLFGLAISPVAAALTDTTGHATRSMLMGLFIVLLSMYGFFALTKIRLVSLRYAVVIVVFVALALQSALYLHNYFTAYASARGVWEIYDFKEALTKALVQQPQRIVISDQANQPYIYQRFYELLIPNPSHIPIVLGSPAEAEPQTCVIYFSWNNLPFPATNISFQDLMPATAITQVRCY